MYIRFSILQVLLILSTECYSIKLKNKENKTTTIKITIPITSQGIGAIRVDEIKPEDECCGEQDTKTTIPVVYAPKMEDILPEPIDNNEINETVAVPIEEPIIESVRASGDPFIYQMYRPVSLYPIYPPDQIPSDVSEDPAESLLNEMEGPASSEEFEQKDPVTPAGLSTPYSTYRPLPLYPFRPLNSNNPNQTDLPVQSKEPLTLNDDTRQLLRNLMLLNIAHQSNIPCEIVPVPPTNRAATEDKNQGTEIENEDGYDGTPNIIPVTRKVTNL